MHFRVVSSLLLVFSISFFAFTTPALAAKNGWKNATDSVQEIEISYTKKSGKVVTLKAYCHAGEVVQKRTRKGNLQVRPIQKQIKTITKKIKQRSGNLKKLKKKKKANKKRKKLGAPICAELLNGDDPENGEDDDTPPTLLNFGTYSGNFGMREAEILYSRFAFGASKEELEQAVALGLQGTVNKLLTWVNSPQLDADMLDIQCDRYLQSEELLYDDDPNDDNRECNPLNPRDFDMSGLVESWYHAFMHGPNPFFYKFMTFIHSERSAAQIDTLPTYRRHFARDHFIFLQDFAKNLDYAWFVRNQQMDGLVGFHNLNLGENSVFNPLQAPNEDYAREVLELTTMSPENFAGTPNYGPFDIASAALSLSGRGYNQQGIPIGPDDEGDMQYVTIESPALIPAAHISGPKTIFLGTPFQQTIEDGADLADAILSHPETYFHMAEELITHFLHPNPNEASIQFIADMIQADGGDLENAIRTLMQATEQYLPSNQKTLIKSPIDLIIGFLRSTNYRFSHRNVRDRINAIGQHLGQPGNNPAGRIFGWLIPELATEPFVVPRRNAFISIIHTLPHEVYEYSFYDEFVADLDPGALPAEALVDSLTERMGVRDNNSQRDLLVEYLNYNWETCNGGEPDEFGCTPGEKFAKREAFDPAPDAPHHLMRNKIRGLLVLLATTVDYQLK